MSRHRLPLILTFICFPAMITFDARADKIASAVKSSSSPSHKIVQDLIDAQVRDLAADDAQVQKTARETLVFECGGHSGASASPQYGAEYTADLSKAIAPLLKSPSIRTRVNAAVVINDVAGVIYKDGGSAAALTPSVQTLLQDKQPAVALWGTKAARYIIASDLAVNANPAATADLVVKAVEAHPESGPIIEEATVSLTLEGQTFQKLRDNPAFQQQAAMLLPPLLDLIAWRGNQFKNGAPTPSPLADKPITVFLSVSAYNAVQSDPAVLKRALKVLGELTCAAMQSAANNNNASDLLAMIKYDGDAFEAFGHQMPNNEVQSAGKAISEMGLNTDPTRMTKLCDDLSNALKGVGVDIATGAAEPPQTPALAGSAGK